MRRPALILGKQSATRRYFLKKMFSKDSASQFLFVYALVLLAYVFGVATDRLGWFPSSAVRDGWDQLTTIRAALFSDDHPAAETRVYRRHGVDLAGDAEQQPGYTLVPSIWKDFDWEPGLKLLDTHGRVVHSWRISPTVIFPEEFSGLLSGLNRYHQPHGSYLFSNGDILVNIANTGTARLDGCARVKWRVRGNNHHSIARADDGSFWISGSEGHRAADPLTGRDSVIHDILVHLSETGQLIEKIRIFDIIERNESLLRHHLRYRPRDTHLNDVEPLPASMAEDYPLLSAGDLLVSLRDLNVVFVVNPESLEVKWWNGDTMIMQHDPDFAGGGWIGVFNNRTDGTERGTRLGGSQVFAFEPHTGSTQVWYQPSGNDWMYTRDRGNWQLLENGNVLITESTTGRVAEVDSNGRFVWEWNNEPYSESDVPIVYWAERYGVTERQIASWPCSVVSSEQDETD